MTVFPALVVATLIAPPAASPTDCAALVGTRIRDGTVVSAVTVAATDGLPAYCRVLGLVRPAVNFELRLPLADWNGKFYLAGCGGYCGSILADLPTFTNAINHALRRGYAVSSMDSGHWGSTLWDGRWAWNNRLAEVDWGHRAVHVTAEASKAVVRAFYGAAEKHAYFAGCSTGGRMASMEAWRYPDDFDGIINGAPALDYTAGVGTVLAWVAQANAGPDGREILTAPKMKLVADAVYAACDPRDGLRDGLIDDPRDCDWQPKALACRPGQRDGCLTSAEVRVLEKWYDGPKDSRGRQLFPGGLARGSEPFWPLWFAGDQTFLGMPLGPVPLARQFTTDFLRYMAFPEDPGERYSPLRFDFDRDPARMAPLAAIYNSDHPDLSAFRNRSGKMIMYHGWADPVLPPLKSVDYYEKVERRMGGREATREFLRLFMLPGYDHCGSQGAPGVRDVEADFDLLTALENWVERGQPPQSILMTRHGDDGKPLWSRPVCPYPQRARLIGRDPTDAASFACELP